MKDRRHHNNHGLRGIKGGQTRRFAKRLSQVIKEENRFKSYVKEVWVILDECNFPVKAYPVEIYTEEEAWRDCVDIPGAAQKIGYSIRKDYLVAADLIYFDTGE